MSESCSPAPWKEEQGEPLTEEEAEDEKTNAPDERENVGLASVLAVIARTFDTHR